MFMVEWSIAADRSIHTIMRGGICNPCINIEYQLLANELGRLVHWSLSCVGILHYGLSTLSP